MPASDHGTPFIIGPLLIVNADDFGMTAGISAGILAAHHHGIVTSTSVLANGRALSDYATRLRDSALGVGVHLAIVGEDPPLLSSSEIPTLVDRAGRFSATWTTVLRRMLAGRVDPDDIAREFRAQLERVRSYELALTHLDAHQHLQLWPSVRDVVLALASETGIQAVRVPRYRYPSPVGLGVSTLATLLARAADRQGVRYTADSVGIAIAGRLDRGTLERLVARVATRCPASIELTVHPGQADDPERIRYRWAYHWEQELAALTSREAVAAVARSGYRLGTYADLATSSAL